MGNVQGEAQTLVYEARLLPSAQRDLDSLSGASFNRLQVAIDGFVRDPRPHGSQKLTGEEGYRIRVGDFRILYRVDDRQKVVFIYRVKHRREVYR